MYAHLRQENPPRRRRRWPWVTAAVLTPIVAAGGVVWALRTQGSPEEVADAYLAAWAKQDYAGMRAMVSEPPADFEQWHRRFRADLKLTGAGFARKGSGEEIPFRAKLDGVRDWSYDGELRLVEADRAWKVSWTPATIHPSLKQGWSVRAVTESGSQTPVLAADGTRVDTPGAPGSVQQLVEGMKETFPDRFGAGAGSRIALFKAGREVQTLLAPATKKPLRTTIDLKVHRAAAAALDAAKKPASLVALRPSTGEILAVVNKPGGFNRALLGKYPPGSTFKVVTASALVAGGKGPDETVECPAEQNIGGFPFHNAGFHDYGTLSFRDAFAHSCNTTFGALSVADLGASRLAKVAADFGFGAPITPGVPAVRAEFPAPKDDTDLASASIGQGRVLTSPLNMASVAAAIADGSWRAPRLVAADLLPGGSPRARPLEPQVVKALRSLMPAVVSEGTAQAVRFPAGTAGKTGTAEYGSGRTPPAHSWFVGYRGDLAFAVIVEGAGAGAAVAAPISASFLSALG
ncbi:penicillin-binding transpeptidase domain-containing protein [Nonomuraea sp. NBC_01738]|uniref:penicillin-binding transpeptidase domain-containing protein n=1 Tax=Nonomuraea sp. NBC_01738 TaxID=2976003 RepID=UPI002E0FD10F|nr:penicillin-binding transpeptidase domain-containing protein [Nonomuraea sp. NBC_01738]